MSLESGRRERAGRLSPLSQRPAILLLGVSLVVLLGLVLAGALSPILGLLAGGVMAATAVWSEHAARSAQSASSGAVALERAAAALSWPDDIIAQVVAAMPEAALVLDGGGAVVAANARAVALAPGLRRGEPVLFALRMPAVIDAIRRAAGGQPQRAEFSERVPVDRWFEAHVVPVEHRDPAGRRLLLLTFQDLTPLRRIEEMRADFVANASHELRTPLAALAGFVDTLQGPARDDTEARTRFLAIMKEQAQRMGRLIDDLLSLSRIELNAHIPPDTAVELVGVVRQVVDALQLLAREREVAVSVTAPDRLMVRGDRDELIRAFENLVENALKYGGAGKRVEIVIEAVGLPDGEREAKVAVRDFGPGIAPEHLPRLTERFYRVDIGHSRAEGGTGLGLALVKHSLSRHRGRLVIDSAEGQGSTFTVFLPVHRPAV